MATLTDPATSEAVDQNGTATASSIAPTTPGAYEVRVLVTDPQTGNVHRAQRSFTVIP